MDRPEVPVDFNRTKCACSRCVACCKRQPAAIVLEDWERIKKKLLTDDEGMRKKFWASPGALVKDTLTGETRRIGSITPRYSHGKCIFLDENDRCRIHDVAPFGCSYFDTHMTAFDGHPRSVWMATQHQRPEFQALRNTLPMANHYKPFRY